MQSECWSGESAGGGEGEGAGTLCADEESAVESGRGGVRLAVSTVSGMGSLSVDNGTAAQGLCDSHLKSWRGGSDGVMGSLSLGSGTAALGRCDSLLMS